MAGQERAPNAVTEVRIERIAQMMRTLRFRRGLTAKRLAKEWGLGLDRVHELTAEASRRVCAEVKDPTATGAKVGSTLDRLLDRANAQLAAGGDVSPQLVVAVTNAAKAWAHLSGANAPQKLEVTSKDAGTQAFSLPSEPGPRREALLALRSRIDAMLADCDKQLGVGQ